MEAWQDEPLSATHKEMAEESKAAMKEAKKRLDAALYDVINYGVVTDAYDSVMGQYDDRYEAHQQEVHETAEFVQRQVPEGRGGETEDDKGGEGRVEEGKGQEVGGREGEGRGGS